MVEIPGIHQTFTGYYYSLMALPGKIMILQVHIVSLQMRIRDMYSILQCIYK